MACSGQPAGHPGFGPRALPPLARGLVVVCGRGVHVGTVRRVRVDVIGGMFVPVPVVMPVVVPVTVAGRVRCHCSRAGSEPWAGATGTLEVHRASTSPHFQ